MVQSITWKCGGMPFTLQSQTLLIVLLSKAAASTLLRPFPQGEEPEGSENTWKEAAKTRHSDKRND